LSVAADIDELKWNLFNLRSSMMLTPQQIPAYVNSFTEFTSSLRADLINYLKEHGRTPANSGRVGTGTNSTLTLAYHCRNLCASLVELYEGGYRVHSLNRIAAKHILFLQQTWIQKGQGRGTIENKLTYWRVMICRTRGKKASLLIVPKLPNDIPGLAPRNEATKKDKSFEANGVDVDRVIQTIRKICPRSAMTFELANAFGVRRNEALLMKPEVALHQLITGLAIIIEYGTKGGRERKVKFDEVAQFEVLLRCVEFGVGPRGSMIPASYIDGRGRTHNVDTFENWLNHYKYVLRKAGVFKNKELGGLGVSTHGLRHEYLQKTFKKLTGHDAPIKALGTDQELTVDYAEEHIVEALKEISKRAGHARIRVTGAYLSTPQMIKRLNKALGVQALKTQSEIQPTLEDDPPLTEVKLKDNNES
jgi:integrase